MKLRRLACVLRRQFCTKTLYNYLDVGLFLGISNKDLPTKKNSKNANIAEQEALR